MAQMSELVNVLKLGVEHPQLRKNAVRVESLVRSIVEAMGDWIIRGGQKASTIHRSLKVGIGVCVMQWKGVKLGIDGGEISMGVPVPNMILVLVKSLLEILGAFATQQILVLWVRRHVRRHVRVHVRMHMRMHAAHIHKVPRDLDEKLAR